MPELEFDALVLAGGAAARLGGVDKPGLTVGGRSMLDRVLDACADARTTVVVGPEREAGREAGRGAAGAGEGGGGEVGGGVAGRGAVAWTREQPPGGGPVAAVAAGLPLVTAERVLLLAADLPFLDRRTLHRLLAALDDAEAAMLVDATGRDQPLAAAYRTAPLRASLAALGEPAGRPLRRLVAPLHTARLADPDAAAYDCDTWEELAHAREREQAASEER
ncbi:molybdenum cofactor guanylyltransferase [Kitasatospora humi]|uniref:molybdenum cofactor guanylyltransferase n=1 Tax=Kitasatospora humi TaxID=2893891 RepID=UPI0027DEFCB8|nr:NTP transferase domain-containing protein [Kitasatospora humi]